jgi:vacuolar-type H+-ATPase subunit E/Vma4
MSTETVTAKIEEKAIEKRNEILDGARAEGEKKRDAILNDAKLRAEKITESAKRQAELTVKGIRQSAKQSAKLSKLFVQREIMEEVKKTALKKISALEEKALLDFYCRELGSSDLSGEFLLLPAASDRRFFEKNIATLEKSASAKISVSKEDAKAENGFILTSDKYDVDFSLSEIIAEKFSKCEKDIYDTLFGKGEE